MTKPQKNEKGTRIVNDAGEVAYIVSPDYGIGWFTQNGEKYPDCATDPELVLAVLDMEKYIEDSDDYRVTVHNNAGLKVIVKAIEAYANDKWPNASWVAEGLEVAWAKPGHMIHYGVFDGAESAHASTPQSDSLIL